MITRALRRFVDMAESELRSLIDDSYSLADFEDIRKVELDGHLVTVRGLVDMHNVPERHRVASAALAVDGFAFRVDAYDVSTGEAQFLSTTFQVDPWLQPKSLGAGDPKLEGDWS